MKYVTFLIGFGLTSIGLSYMIAFLNYIVIGYSFNDYIEFIIKRIEFYYVIVGIILMVYSIYNIGDDNNELYIRYNFKSK